MTFGICHAQRSDSMRQLLQSPPKDPPPTRLQNYVVGHRIGDGVQAARCWAFDVPNNL
jgi:hypothetical protein